jgi:hypothetical protein
VHADPFPRDIAERVVDDRDDVLHKSQKIRERLVLVGDVAFEREIRGIDLEHEAAAHNGLILNPQGLPERLQVLSLRIVVLIADRSRNDAGRGRIHEAFDECVGEFREELPEIPALSLDRPLILVSHLSNCHRKGLIGRDELLA